MNYPHGNEQAKRTVEHARESLKERAARARDIVENVRDRAEDAFREKPYLAPVAAGALGLGIGLLLGSRLTRFILFTAVGTFVSETFGPEIKRLSRQLVGEIQRNLSQGEQGEHEYGTDEGEPGTL